MTLMQSISPNDRNDGQEVMLLRSRDVPCNLSASLLGQSCDTPTAHGHAAASAELRSAPCAYSDHAEAPQISRLTFPSLLLFADQIYLPLRTYNMSSSRQLFSRLTNSCQASSTWDKFHGVVDDDSCTPIWQVGARQSSWPCTRFRINALFLRPLEKPLASSFSSPYSLLASSSAARPPMSSAKTGCRRN